LRKKAPFVLEIRDVITGNKIMEQSQTTIEKYTIRSIEKKVIKYVDDFIFLTRFIKEDYIKWQYTNKNVLKGEVITNGYDSEAVENISAKVREKEQILFAHVGSFYGSRNPLKFLQALGEVLKDMEYIKGKVFVEFVGAIPAETMVEIDEIAKKYDIEKNIIMIGKISHDEALEVMVNSSINILITHETGSEYAIPGKIFEYIGTKRPILALSEDILVKELMEENKLGYICSNRSVEKIKSTLKEILENIENINNMELESSNKFSSENQVRSMEEVFLR
jgi:glycosyltransferase involved in cell wall biosynthesis